MIELKKLLRKAIASWILLFSMLFFFDWLMGTVLELAKREVLVFIVFPGHAFLAGLFFWGTRAEKKKALFLMGLSAGYLLTCFLPVLILYCFEQSGAMTVIETHQITIRFAKVWAVFILTLPLLIAVVVSWDLAPKLRFYFAFGFWPADSNEGIQSTIDLKLGRLAQQFLEFCDEETKLVSMEKQLTHFSIASALKEIKKEILRVKWKFWSAHALAAKFGLSMKESVHDYVKGMKMVLVFAVIILILAPTSTGRTEVQKVATQKVVQKETAVDPSIARQEHVNKMIEYTKRYLKESAQDSIISKKEIKEFVTLVENFNSEKASALLVYPHLTFADDIALQQIKRLYKEPGQIFGYGSRHNVQLIRLIVQNTGVDILKLETVRSEAENLFTFGLVIILLVVLAIIIRFLMW